MTLPDDRRDGAGAANPGASRLVQARVGEARYGGTWVVSVSGAPGAGAEGSEDTSAIGMSPSGLNLPFVAEGELVEIALSAANRKHDPAQAGLVSVREPSLDRVEPQCRHFGECGGCQYQHLNAEAQLQVKADILQRLLAKAGVPVPERGIQLHSSAPYAYRNRMRLRVRDGVVGYNRRASHEFLPIAECPIVSPLLWRAVSALLQMTQTGVASWPAAAAEVEMFATDDDTALQMSVHMDAAVSTLDRDAPAAFRKLCEALRERVPELHGAGLLVQAAPVSPTSRPSTSRHSTSKHSTIRRVEERQRVEVARWGGGTTTYHVAGRAYSVSRNAFFQVNRFLTARMVELVTRDRHGALAMDLFAGAGLFSLTLTENFSRVIAVEIGEPAASDLHKLLQAAGPRHRAERSTTLDFLRRWNRAGSAERPHLVVADPPRAGLGLDVVREIVRLGAEEFVSVSCDPVTFARDAQALIKSGYAAAELHLLDLFPQSFHMETIAVFRPR